MPKADPPLAEMTSTENKPAKIFAKQKLRRVNNRNTASLVRISACRTGRPHRLVPLRSPLEVRYGYSLLLSSLTLHCIIESMPGSESSSRCPRQ